jgi:hypothetical protein
VSDPNNNNNNNNNRDKLRVILNACLCSYQLTGKEKKGEEELGRTCMD